MDIAAIQSAITSIGSAIGLVTKAQSLSANIQNQEIRQIVHDLNDQLISVREDLFKVRTENFDLREQNLSLKERVDKLSQPAELVVIEGYYRLQKDVDKNEFIPYCGACYQTKQKMFQLLQTRPPESVMGNFKCPSCHDFF